MASSRIANDTAPRAGLPYQPALDGLRGVSVALVLAFHAGFGWMSGGYVGVSVFFTLSGYLITSLAVAEWDRSGGLDVRAFYGRRLRRLMPASLLCLAAVIVAAFAGQFSAVVDLRRDLWAALAQVYNWVTLAAGEGYAEQMAGVAGQRAPLDHYWSLAIEEQFYLVWPLALLAVLRLSPARRIVAVAALLLAFGATAVVIAATFGDAATYLATPARLPEILWGCLLGVAIGGSGARAAVPKPPLRFAVRAADGRVARALGAPAALGGLGVIVIGWAAVTWPADRGPAYDGWLPLFSVASVAVIVGVQVASPLRDALSLRPLVALGKISYGVYLYHWPVYAIVDERRIDIGSGGLFGVRVAITVALAAVSYAVVEQPIRRRAVAWRPTAGVAGAICVVIALVVALTPDPAPRSYVYAGAAAADRVAIGEIAPGARQVAIGERPARVLVIGDSTAMATASGLIEWADAHSGMIEVSSAAVMGCGLNLTGELPEDEYRDTCIEVVGGLPTTVERLQPDVVLAMVTFRDMADRGYGDAVGELEPGDPRFDDRLLFSYRALTGELLAAGAGAVAWVVPPIPDLPEIGELVPLLDPERHDAYAAVLHALSDAMDDSFVIDVRAWLAEHPDPPERHDGLHWSPDGAIDLADRLLALILLDLVGEASSVE